MPRHLTVPPGGFHHPSAAAADFASATATPTETYDNGKNDGDDEERLSGGNILLNQANASLQSFPLQLELVATRFGFCQKLR
ncbi:hypothetical protein ACJIZ3_017772 [Penstemon smallii]|uniref:Uncharacterized protein n=1 Tax=Penstemon smallii TaxID=265156 RepID=A0ABD3SX96_9LAMI